MHSSNKNLNLLLLTSKALKNNTLTLILCWWRYRISGHAKISHRISLNHGKQPLFLISLTKNENVSFFLVPLYNLMKKETNINLAFFSIDQKLQLQQKLDARKENLKKHKPAKNI